LLFNLAATLPINLACWSKAASFAQHETCGLRMIKIFSSYRKIPPVKLISADISSAALHAGYHVRLVTTPI
jgi:hypothetical protein